MRVARIPLAQTYYSPDASAGLGTYFLPQIGSGIVNGVIEKASGKPCVVKRRPMTFSDTLVSIAMPSGVAYGGGLYVDQIGNGPAYGLAFAVLLDTTGAPYIAAWDGTAVVGVPGVATTALALGLGTGYTNVFCYSPLGSTYFYVWAWSTSTGAYKVATVTASTCVVSSTVTGPALQANISNVVFFDNYLVITAGAYIYNTDFQDWGLNKTVNSVTDFQANYVAVPFNSFITSVAYNGVYLLVATVIAVYAYIDAGNPNGSVLGIVKEATMPLGTLQLAASPFGVGFRSFGGTNSQIFFVPFNSPTPQKISTDSVQMNDTLAPGGIFVATMFGRPFVCAQVDALLMAFDIANGEWYVWYPPAGFVAGAVSVQQVIYQGGTSPSTTVIVRQPTAAASAGLLFSDPSEAIDSATWQDSVNGVLSNYPFVVQTREDDIGVGGYKTWGSATLKGLTLSASTPISVQYTDDGYQTWSTLNRTVDMSMRNPVTHQLGYSQTRAWRVVYTGPNGVKLEAIEVTI